MKFGDNGLSGGAGLCQMRGRKARNMNACSLYACAFHSHLRVPESLLQGLR